MTPDRVLELLPYIWLALISLAAVCVTLYDKLASKRFPNHRTPEKTLFFIAWIGGSIVMYTTMHLVRHKTQHKSFMIGIPLIILAQIAIIAALVLLF